MSIKWNIEQVSDKGTPTDLTRADPIYINGEKAIVWTNNIGGGSTNSVIYSRYDVSEEKWKHETIISGTTLFVNPSVVEYNNKAVVVFARQDSPKDKLYYATREGNRNWTLNVIFETNGEYTACKVAISDNGTPAVASVNTNGINNVIRYHNLDSSGDFWSSEIVANYDNDGLDTVDIDLAYAWGRAHIVTSVTEEASANNAHGLFVRSSSAEIGGSTAVAGETWTLYPFLVGSTSVQTKLAPVGNDDLAILFNINDGVNKIYLQLTGRDYVFLSGLYLVAQSTTSGFGQEMDIAAVGDVCGFIFNTPDGSDFYYFNIKSISASSSETVSGVVINTYDYFEIEQDFVEGSFYYPSLSSSNSEFSIGFYGGSIYYGVYNAELVCNTDPCATPIDEYCYFDPAYFSVYGRVHGGKWFYSHSKPGTAWFDQVDNIKGWTVDFNLQVLKTEDSEGLSLTDGSDGLGLYVNDGSRQESIYFTEQEIVFANQKRGYIFDSTSPVDFRLTGKENKINLFAKKEDESEHTHVASLDFGIPASDEGNGDSPSAYEDSDGNVHVVWHDDGNIVGQIFYSKWDGLSWSTPEQIVQDSFGALNPHISVASDGMIFVVYESKSADGSRIGFIYKNNVGWSDPELVALGSGDAFHPRSTIGDRGDLHIVWEDHRNGYPQIYYTQWSRRSLRFGEEASLTEDDVYGSYRPAITNYLDKIYVSYTSSDSDNRTRILMRYKRRGSEVWTDSKVVTDDSSSMAYSLADYSDILSTADGRIFVVWQDDDTGTNAIYSRHFNADMQGLDVIRTLTASPSQEAKYPRMALHEPSGNIYVAWEDKRNTGSVLVYAGIWDDTSKSWATSGQGAYDIRMQFGDDRESTRPAVPPYFQGELHILYVSDSVSKTGDEYLLPSELFSTIRDVIYDLTLNQIYIPQYSEYHDRDLLVSDRLYRKEIRFGDFSNTLSAKFRFKYLKYYLKDAVEPFRLTPISADIFSTPPMYATAALINNYGDSWFTTTCGTYFYFNKERTLYEVEDENIKGLPGRDIAFDNNNNLYVVTKDDIFASSDHKTFDSIGLPSSSPSSAGDIVGNTAINFDDKNRLWYANVFNGVTATNISMDGNDFSAEGGIRLKPEDLPNELISSGDTSLQGVNIRSIVMDGNGIVWICTSRGLVRYFNGSTIVFTSEDGLPSSRVNDIAIRNNAIRYVATANGIAKMVGTSFEHISAEEGDIWNNNVRSVRFREPNIIWAGTLSRINQILEKEDGSYSTVMFNPSLYTTSVIEADEFTTFYILIDQDEVIDPEALVEVYINGNRISHGFVVSLLSENPTIKFDTPLLDTDVVDVVIRNGVSLLASFAQSDAEKTALGESVIRVKEISRYGDSVYVSVGGDENKIKLNDNNLPFPFDSTELDTEAPQGCLRIVEQIDSGTVRVAIDQVDENTPFDTGTGASEMIISNFSNFTVDGTVPQTAIPFARTATHSLVSASTGVSTENSISGSLGNVLSFVSDNSRLYLGTSGDSGNAIVQIRNNTDTSWDTAITYTATDKVDFIKRFNEKIVIGLGTSDPSINARIHVYSDDGNYTLEQEIVTSGDRLYSAVELDGKLYMGSDDGKIYAYDGEEVSTAFSEIGTNVYGLTAVKNLIYAATGESGYVYRLSPEEETAMISHSDSDSQMKSIASLDFNESSLVFVGAGTEGKILRTNIEKASFNVSFSSLPASVNSIKNFNDVLYAAVGRSVYMFSEATGSWAWRYTHDEIINDLAVINEVLFVVSESKVTRIEKEEEKSSIYLKIIDRAGNESAVFDDDGEVLDCASASLTISEAGNIFNENKILEVDDLGNEKFTYTGEGTFYSADRIDEEIGIYDSEVFNGTNDLVKWDSISWQSSEPLNTSVDIYVRTGDSRNDVLTSNFVGPFTQDQQSGVDLGFLGGTFLQFRAVLRSSVAGLSPALTRVIVKTITAESVHFFTTNFVLPAAFKRGILTADTMVPVAADIVFGVNTEDSIDFSEYQKIDVNRLFDVGDDAGKNLRVGIRLLSPSRSTVLAAEFDEYGPYSTSIFINTIDFDYTNTGPTALFDFVVSLYRDVNLTDLAYSSSTSDGTSGWSADGLDFPTSGKAIGSSDTSSVLFSVPSSAVINCNEFFFVKVEAVNKNTGSRSVVSDDKTFIAGCSASFIDNIDFEFTNTSGSSNDFHFRIRYYEDGDRTSLLRTDFSGNNRSGWVVDNNEIPEAGVRISDDQTVSVFFTPVLTEFEPNKLMYLIIDAFDGQNFLMASKAYTFQANDIQELIYCGPYSNVPVVKNFAMMFELVDNEFVTLNIPS